MTQKEAIDSLTESCNTLLSAVEQLKEENMFLADTIEKHNLGTISKERKQTLKIREEAERLQKKYETLITDVESKQQGIDLYIDNRAKEMIAETERNYTSQMLAYKKILDRKALDSEREIQEQKAHFRSRNIKLFVVILVSVLFGAAGIVINFL